jgi:antitoxin (DNA-binding transcriptional repressor) of toxin-antitoxin stability system
MEDVSLPYAKEHLEDLVARAIQGEDVVITDAKLGTVKIVATEREAKTYPKRVPGLWKGKISIPDEKLFEPLSEEELAWLSGETSP